MKKKIWVIILVVLVLLYGGYYYKYHDYFGGYRFGDEKGEYVNGEKNGLWTAYYKEYTAIPFLSLLYSKKVFSQGNYIDGNKEGEWVEYYPDGEINTKWNYKNGVLDGEYIWYDRGIYEDDDKSIMKGNYVDGKKDGLWAKEYFQSKGGLSKVEYYYNNGASYKTIFYYIDGRVEEVER